MTLALEAGVGEPYDPDMPASKESPAAFEHRFACIPGCARCCRRPGIVELNAEDVKRLAAYLQLTTAEIEDFFLLREPTLCLRFERDECCPFLAGNDRYAFCAIQEAKPAQCSTYPFWPGLADDRARWKREARFCPGIGKGPAVPQRLVRVEMRRAVKAGCDL